jgi:hypothetical protein
MQICDLDQKYQLRPMTFAVSEVPHATIEVTMQCNIQCRVCYNQNRDFTKSLQEIRSEIDLATTKRNLDTISLLGGEPTLHPQIAEIIKYVKSHDVYCQLLTNGICFLHDPHDRLLDQIVSAGVDRIIVHMDAGQEHVHADPEGDMVRLFDKLEKRQTAFSLAMTIYRNNGEDIPKKLLKLSKYTYFDGILATLERKAADVIIRRYDSDRENRLSAVHGAVSRELGIAPTTYLPGSLDRDRISWLFYFYYINAATGRTFMISPKLNQFFRKLYRKLTGHHVFGMPMKPGFRSLFFLLTVLLELLINPRRLGVLSGLIRRSSLLRSVRFHYIVVQDGPRFNTDKNRLEICYHCPDATIRNGMLTPVCLADHINPLKGEIKRTDAMRDAFMTVYGHMEEI